MFDGYFMTKIFFAGILYISISKDLYGVSEFSPCWTAFVIFSTKFSRIMNISLNIWTLLYSFTVNSFVWNFVISVILQHSLLYRKFKTLRKIHYIIAVNNWKIDLQQMCHLHVKILTYFIENLLYTNWFHTLTESV